MSIAFLLPQSIRCRHRAKVLLIISCITAGLMVANDAVADVILQPVSASTDMGTFGANPPSSAINQSGLSASYTSGVTDFDTFTATTTHGAAGAGDAWVSSGTTTGNFDIDMGIAVSVESMALWNYQGAFGVNAYELFADDNSAFTSPTSLLSGTFSEVPFGSIAEIVSFGPTSAQYFRLQINSNHGETVTGIGEIAFGAAAAVPEPSSFGLLGIGAIGLIYRRRKRKQVA